MHKPVLTTLGLIASISVSNATTVVLDRLSNTDWDSPDTGGGFVNQATVSVDGFQVADRTNTNGVDLQLTQFISENSSTNPETMIWSITGLDLDGVGGNNDGFTVALTVTNHGELFRTIWSGTEPQNSGWLSSGGTTLNANGEFISFTFSSLSINLNGGTGNGAGTFDGFSSARVGSFGAGENAVVNGTAYAFDVYGNDIDLMAGGPDAQLNYTYSTADGATGNWRPEAWGIQISVVPEPSGSALIGLTGLGFILRRRR